MEAQKDFKDLLELFNAHKIDYLIVGGYALAFHGAPRLTGDLDIYVQPNSENANRILTALKGFGFGSLDLSLSDFEKPGLIVQLGVPPVRIDIITSLSGVTWDEVSRGKVSGAYGNVPVHYIGIKEFVKNKKATGRKRDGADIEALGQEQ